MIYGRRWEDWGTTVIGALVALSPLAFTNILVGGTTFAETAAACATIGFGGLIFIVGILTLFFPKAAYLEYAQVVLAVLLFASPFVIGFTGLTVMAWIAYVGAVAVAAVVGARVMESGPAVTPAS